MSRTRSVEGGTPFTERETLRAWRPSRPWLLATKSQIDSGGDLDVEAHDPQRPGAVSGELRVAPGGQRVGTDDSLSSGSF